MFSFENIEGYIFDMDGTLIDSMGMWRDSGDIFLEMVGMKKTREFPLVQCGIEYNVLTQQFMEYYKIDEPFNEVKKQFEKAVAPHYAEKLQLKDGVYEYLHALKRKGKRLSVATATHGHLAIPCLERLGVASLFDIILSTKDIGINKYQPDIYLNCCEIMKTVPQETVVFEDALYAAKTAIGADFKVVGVYDAVFDSDFESLNSLCHHTIKTFKEL